MKAAVLYNPGQPLVIECDILMPSLKAGQVLVKIAYSGVCHSQLMEVRGKRGEDRFLPHLLGHEGSGTVMEIGDGVTKVGPGDRVILGWIKSCGIAAAGPHYEKNGLTINAGPVTTFSDYSIVSENRCVRIPDGVPLDVAVLFGCAIPTGAGMVMNRIKPEKGSTIAVFGLGGIGLSALMATNLFECSSVIAVDIEDSKLELARDFGATHTINPLRQDPLAEINEITKGRGVDYAIEAAGLTKTIETAFNSVRKFGGLCIFASHPQAGARIELDPHQLISGKRIEGSWGGSSDPDRDVPELAVLYREGKLPLEKLLSDSYTLDGINQAIDDLEERRIVRALVDMGHGRGI